MLKKMIISILFLLVTGSAYAMTLSVMPMPFALPQSMSHDRIKLSRDGGKAPHLQVQKVPALKKLNLEYEIQRAIMTSS